MPYPELPRPDVPAPIAVIRDFVNTTEFETGHDELATPGALATYLLAAGLLAAPARATGTDLRAAHRLRAGLREALEHNHDGNRVAQPDLASALADLDIGLTWSPDGAVLVARRTGVRGALARIGIAAHTAASDGLWWRLKICSSDTCGWAYYDHSKNRSRQWCEYGCGNRIKTRAYRARQKASVSPD